MTNIFKLPKVIDDGRIDLILKLINFAKSCPNGDKEIVLDWSKTVGISPAGMAMLACICDVFIEQKNKVTNKGIPGEFAALPIIANIQKIEGFATLPEAKINNFEDTAMIVRGIGAGIDTFFTERIGEKFSGKISMDMIYNATLIINELMQNSADHSSSERCYMYAGLWDKEFHAGLLDMGITIPAKLEQKYVCGNDLEYIELSLEKGSSTRRQRIGGFGLYYFFEFLRDNEGKLTIVSRNAQLRKYFKTRKSQKNILKYPLPGTWCFARFPLEE